MQSTCRTSNVFSRYLLSLTYPPHSLKATRFTPGCGQNWRWIWDGHELTGLRVNHSRSAVKPPHVACGLLLVVLSTTDTADVEACGKHLIRYHNRIKSVSEEVTSSGIASSDRLRGQTRNPPSRSRRTEVRPPFARAAVGGAGAWSRRPPPPRCSRWGSAPNPICCGATGEGPAAAAARPGRLYCPAPAGGGGRSKGRAGRSARSKIWSPSCCSSQRWSTPSGKTSYFASLWWQLLESRDNRGLIHREGGGTWVYNAIRYGRMKSEISTGLTYTFTVLEESKCSVPRVQVDSNDGALSKPGGEVHLVPFMMQQAWRKGKQ